MWISAPSGRRCSVGCKSREASSAQGLRQGAGGMWRKALVPTAAVQPSTLWKGGLTGVSGQCLQGRDYCTAVYCVCISGSNIFLNTASY